jgi:predicted  nucleic acid-binding Zn-ribbon protein
MPLEKHSKLFSRASNLAYDIKELYEDLKTATMEIEATRGRIVELEKELSEKISETERLCQIIQDQSDELQKKEAVTP